MTCFFTPSTATTAPAIPEATLPAGESNLPVVDALMRFVRLANLTGCPAVSLPMGFNREGLPLSLQIVTPEWQEARALAIANAYEEATPELRARRPPC